MRSKCALKKKKTTKIQTWLYGLFKLLCSITAAAILTNSNNFQVVPSHLQVIETLGVACLFHFIFT